MARNCRLQHIDRQCRARAFAKPQAQLKQRLLAKLRQKRAVRRLGAGMACDTVIERPFRRHGQCRRRRRADEPVQDDRDSRGMGSRDRASHGSCG